MLLISSLPEKKIETLEVVLLKISRGLILSRSWAVIKSAWMELKHWRRMEKRAREMVYSDSGFCKGFILVWDKDPEYFKKKLVGSVEGTPASFWGAGLDLSAWIGTGKPGSSLLRPEMAGRTWRLGAGGEGFAVGYFGKGRKSLGSLKGLF